MGAENLVPVEIPVPASVALGRFLDELGHKLRERGLTDELVDEELAAYNAGTVDDRELRAGTTPSAFRHLLKPSSPRRRGSSARVREP